jgi:hypothetical protein
VGATLIHGSIVLTRAPGVCGTAGPFVVTSTYMGPTPHREPPGGR